MKAVDAKLTQIVETSCCSTNYLTKVPKDVREYDNVHLSFAENRVRFS